MDKFEEGLKASLVHTIYTLPEMPKTLKSQKDWALKFDKQQRQYEEKHKTSSLMPKKTWEKYTPQEKVAHPWTAVMPSATSTSKRDGTRVVFGGQGQPMDIDRACSGGACYVCGQKGHIAKYCSNKAKIGICALLMGLSAKNRTKVRRVLAEKEQVTPKNFPEESQ